MYIPSPRSRPTGRESPATVPTPVAPAPAPILTAPSISTAAPDRGGGVCVAIPRKGCSRVGWGYFRFSFFRLQSRNLDSPYLHAFTPDRSAISTHGAHSGGTPRNSTGTSTGTGGSSGSDSGSDGISSSCHCSTGSRGRCVRDGPSPRGGTDSSGNNSSST